MTDYKVLRTTLQLVINSKVFASGDLHTEARQAVRKAVEANYRFDDLPHVELETLEAFIDGELAEAAKAEYLFVPTLGAIRDHGACVAHCELCGKGDSKGDGSDLDKLRYDFRLTNTAGGTDLWAGSTCIINYGLKVDGAATQEEASKILQRTLREHLNLWKIQAWQAANPDHESVEDDYSEIARWQRRAWSFRRRYGEELRALGVDVASFQNDVDDVYRAMRKAKLFYARKAWLTPGKDAAWQRTRRVLATLASINETLRQAEGYVGDARIDYLSREDNRCCLDMSA